MTPLYPTEDTQEARLLNVLLNAKGDWVLKSYFERTMMLSQAGRVIWDLENRFHWKGKIEHSKFTDEFGFKSFRILQDKQQLTLI